jgi:hypothetical protein
VIFGRDDVAGLGSFWKLWRTAANVCRKQVVLGNGVYNGHILNI